MKRKTYTKGHDICLLKEIDNEGGQFTAEEHAYAIKKEFSDYFNSRDSLIRWYFSENAKKLSALGFLIERVYGCGYKNIVSLGAGTCVLEYILKLALPGDSKVVATDFDPFLVEKAGILFPDLITVKFDLFNDGIGELHRALGIDFDVAVFFGSSYVMDDEQFIRFFGDLKRAGVKEIIDFQGGYIDWLTYFYNLKVLSPLRNWPPLRRLLGKPPLDKSYAGKFHGYTRSRGEMRRLYRGAGLDIAEETALGGYKYVAICKPGEG